MSLSGSFNDVRALASARLNEAMSDLNLNGAKLSKASGISAASISQYLHGVSIPSKATALKLSAVLKVNPAWLQGLNGFKYADLVINEDAAGSVMDELRELELLYVRLPDRGRAELKTLMGYLVYKYEGSV
jgi:transcriptional regulator with XRE-family HTH domain